MTSPRVWLIRLVGITGLTLLTLFIFFNFVGKTDVSWALPWKQPFRPAWPELPRFATWKATTPDGQQETLYQVPTRQLTKAEVRQLSYTPGATDASTSAAPAAR